jgi:serine/threonine protein kinase
MKTDAPSTCSGCGDALSPSTLDGLCPQCVGKIIFTGASPEEIAAAANLAVPANKNFGDYELLEEIARGGMGVVFKARHRPLNRIVAIKMMLAGQLAGVLDARRFRAEAEAVARLQHPNIVAIHEVGEHEGFQFFSMDYVAGVNLAELVRSEILQPKRAANYLKTIAEAIHYAHQQGIIHRDLKPSNILLDAAGQPRVTDFGLAKRLAGSAESTLQLTVTGQIFGTPAFIPPEQAAGRHGEVGPRSDIYSLGAVLYFMLTGQPPFSGKSLEEILFQVVHQPLVSPRKLNAAVPRDLETICLKCLEKEPARRYAGAQELADDLGRFLHDEPITARPVATVEKFWRVCKRHPAITGLTASLSVALLVLSTLLAGRLASHFQKQIIPDMPLRSANGVSGIIDGKLYVTTPADGTDGYRNNFHVYDPRLNSWSRKPEPPIPHEYGAGGVVNGKLYVVSGTDWQGKISHELDVFDPLKDNWTTKAPIPTMRVSCASAVYNGKFYVVGGAGPDSDNVGTFESYDPQRDTWTIEAPMLAPTDRIGAAVLDGKLYVVGGITDKTIGIRSKTVEIYDFAARKWYSGPSLPEGRSFSFVTALYGRLYVAGGDVPTNVGAIVHGAKGAIFTNFYAASASLLTLDPKAARWKELAPMPEPRLQGDGAQVLDGRIWCLGGWTYETYGGAVHANVFIYDPKRNSWTSSGTAQ